MKATNLKWIGLAFVCLASLPVATPIADAGREYSRCIHACNFIRRACDDRCSDQCRANFPNSQADRNACLSACHEVCVDQAGDCKDRCLAIKKGDVTPQEP